MRGGALYEALVLEACELSLEGWLRARAYRPTWVEVLDVGEMWEIKTGPRNLGAFASEEDYAQAQAAWARATETVKAANAAGK